MPKLTFPGRVLTGLFLLLIPALALSACGAPGSSQPAQGHPDITVALAPAPAGPSGQFLTVTLTDRAGAAITDVRVGLEGNMNHAGMIPVLADPVADDADGSPDGVYTVPFAFTMRGDWIVTVAVTQADGATFSQDFDLSVTADQVQVK